MAKPHITIISPASAKANNGNWQTATRWARFLQEQYRVSLAPQWDGSSADAMIALHARRSAESIAAFKEKYPARPAILALTGTDLYRDIKADTDAQRSLRLAACLVVLQDAALSELSPDLAGKTHVIYQSARSLKPIARSFPPGLPTVAMIGHLRKEKDPQTFMRAAALISADNVRLIHIGGALEPALEADALSTQLAHPRYRWLGNLPHAKTRQKLKQCHLMVIASIMEGGANVIIEALTSGVPVLASDIPGNRGMLGDDYAGYFPVGDSQALAQLIDRSVSDHAYYLHLQTQCQMRVPLFSPKRERMALLQLVDNALTSSGKNS